MPTEKQFKGIKNTFKVSSSDPNRKCPKCSEVIIQNSVDKWINHMTTEHGHMLLNIGTETDEDGSRTVAYFGTK